MYVHFLWPIQFTILNYKVHNRLPYYNWICVITSTSTGTIMLVVLHTQNNIHNIIIFSIFLLRTNDNILLLSFSAMTTKYNNIETKTTKQSMKTFDWFWIIKPVNGGLKWFAEIGESDIRIRDNNIILYNIIRAEWNIHTHTHNTYYIVPNRFVTFRVV